MTESTGADTPEIEPQGPVRRPGRRRRIRRRRHESWAVAAVAAVACVLLSDAAPTGLTIVDALWRAAFGILVTVAASKGRRVPTVWMAAVAVAAGAGSWWVLVAIAALAIAVFVTFEDHRSRPVAAVVGLLCSLALLHIPAMWFFGFPSLLAALAVAPVLVSAYGRSDKRDRRRLRAAMIAAASVVVVASIGAAVGALFARPPVQSAVDAAERGLTFARDGNEDEAVRTLFDARASFVTAADRIDAPWTWPGSILPIVGPNLRALRSGIESGRSVVEASQIVVASAPWAEVRLADGRVDLATLVSFRGPVANLQSSVHESLDEIASVESGWVVGPVARPLTTFTDELARTGEDIDTVAAGLEVLPAVLGADGTRTYLVEFANTAETRFLGGFAGSWGLLDAAAGRLSLRNTDSIGTLNDKLLPRYPYIAPPDYRERYDRFHPDLFAQNWTASPDFPDDAFVSMQLFEQAEGTPVDGVMMIDPEGLAALLKLTGPVRVAGLTAPLDASNVVDYITLGQYKQYEGQIDLRRDQLSKVASAVFDALSRTSLPGVRGLADAMGPAVRGGHLAFWTDTEDANAFIDRVGLSGRFPSSEGGDLLSLRTANSNPNKIDSFLHRTMRADVTVDPTSGAVSSEVVVTLTNRAPSSGLPLYVIGNDEKKPVGSNTMYLSLYSPLTIEGATMGGAPLALSVQREFGIYVYSTTLTVPSGATVELHVSLEGVLPSIVTSGRYSLIVPAQPMVHSDRLDLRVHSTDPASPVTIAEGTAAAVADGSLVAATVLDETWSGSAAFSSAGG